MAMAFAAFAVVTTADESDAVKVFGNDEVVAAPQVIDDDTYTKFFVSEDMTVKVKLGAPSSLTFYVQNGKTLEVDFKEAVSSVTIVTVTGDQGFEQAGTGATAFDGKYVDSNTQVVFAGSVGMSVYYKAATTSYDVSYNGSSFSYKYKLKDNAQFSSDKAFDANPTMGSKVSVASGQTIVVESDSEIDADIGGVFGIKYSAVTTGTTTTYAYTYYATKTNAGDIELSDGESVKIKNGTAAITTSGASVKAVSVQSSAGVTIAGGSEEGSFDIDGTMTKGSMTLGGLVDPGTMTVEAEATLTLANKAEVFTAASVTVDGGIVVKTAGTEDNPLSNLTVSGSTTGVITVENGKVVNDDGAGIKVTTSSFNGLVDTSAVNKIFYGETGIATAVIEEDQTFDLINSTSIYRSLLVKGILIVEPGVTLTLENGAAVTAQGQYAQIINNGKIIVKAGADDNKGLFVNGGVFVNNGTIDFSAKQDAERDTATFSVSTPLKFTNNGTMTFSKNDTIAIQNFDNNGTMNISAKVVGATTVTNNGRMVYNGAEIGANTTSVVASKNATVFISSVKMTKDIPFSVCDDATDPSVSAVVSGTGASLDEFTVRGVTFTGGSGAIDLQGAMGLAIATGSEGTVTFSIDGATTVKDSFSTPKAMVLEFASGSEMDVSGLMTTNKETAGNTGSNLALTVTGKVVDNNNVLNGCTYVAAKYETTNSTIYTTLSSAVLEAYMEDVMSIEVGEVTVAEDLVIPAGMTINGAANPSTVYIGTTTDAVDVYITSTGRLSVDNIVIVNGVVFAEDSADISDENVKAHVKNEDGDSVTYMSLNCALLAAEPGDYVELFGDFVLSDSAITIPAGVTVDATANDGKMVAFINSNLGVNGTLIVDPFYFIAEDTDDIAITVQGFLKDGGASTNDIKGKWFTPIGVSYYESTIDIRGDEVTYFVITSLDNLQYAVDTADEKKVTVEGKAKLGDVTIRGDEDEPAQVTFNEDISAGTITLENAIIIAKPGKQITATFADELGAITITGAYVADGNKDVNIYSLGNKGVYMSGPVTDSTKGVYSILFTGKTGTNNATIGWGNYLASEAYPTITFAGETLVTGNKNQIKDDYDLSSEYAGVVSIPGTVTVDNGSKLLIVADVDVLGTLEAKERTSSSTNGSIEVEGNIFLGITKAAVFNEKALLAATNHIDDGYYALYGLGLYETTAAAKLAGKIDMIEDRFITQFPGTSIDESIIEDMESMDIIIDGKVWLTIYGVGTFNMDGLTPVITDCSVDRIYDADGVVVAQYSQAYGVIYNSNYLVLGLNDAIYMDLDYKIYTVLIKTDASIKAVYIDDILTYTGNEENQFFLYRVEAGTHTVAVEPATDYNADKAYLYDEDGKKLSGLKFTFNQNDCIWVDDLLNPNGGYYEVIYNVAGTEKIVDPEPLPPEQVSEWTVTTILLLVLVILIAVMAVIVALRLNRS